jgi:hypothetical protein
MEMAAMTDTQFIWILATISTYGIMVMIVVRAWGKKILNTVEGRPKQ